MPHQEIDPAPSSPHERSRATVVPCHASPQPPLGAPHQATSTVSRSTSCLAATFWGFHRRW
ncbi:hypothetical protein E2562_030432 [Oryza meyeriana var. granulata]|uniref:Uncharacterized protein n=1 Tax=Oryza meyeriana var. granulata TaxID=110450 RepID=A0A6G1FE48_9ORYZ|nr:hypothetical protein E2562_030432 [Oryza meyeriana var. granulata]